MENFTGFHFNQTIFNIPWQIFHEKLENPFICSICGKYFLGIYEANSMKPSLKVTNLVKIENELIGYPKKIDIIHYLILNAYKTFENLSLYIFLVKEPLKISLYLILPPSYIS